LSGINRPDMESVKQHYRVARPEPEDNLTLVQRLFWFVDVPELIVAIEDAEETIEHLKKKLRS
jgi:hypothetical protein